MSFGGNAVIVSCIKNTMITNSKILIVEDNHVIRQELLDVMEMENYQVVEAKDGNEGIQLAKEKLPDIIISDMLMPNKNGLEMMKEIKSNPITENIPFIFLSALSDKEYIRNTLDLGAEDYLTKPIDTKDLLQAIRLKLRVSEKNEERLNQLRLNVLKSIPHELRTSLNSILGFSYLIKNDNKRLSENEIKQFAEHINESGNRVLHLIENYITYVKLTTLSTDSSSILELKENYCNCTNKIIRKCINELSYNSNEYVLQTQDAEINIKHEHLEILITEIISNAVKFSDKGGLIKISSLINNNKLVLTVENKASGISQKQISNIGAFMQFNRGVQEQQGVGIGLSIIKLISNIYNLDFNIKSELNKFFKICISFSIKDI